MTAHGQAKFESYLRTSDGRRELATIVESLIGDTQPDSDQVRRLVSHARNHLRKRFTAEHTW